jgi:hypothetical protein
LIQRVGGEVTENLVAAGLSSCIQVVKAPWWMGKDAVAIQEFTFYMKTNHCISMPEGFCVHDLKEKI